MNGRTSWLPLRALVTGALFTALTAAGAWISVPLPFSPVPITLQSLFPLLAGATIGPVGGALAELAYVLLGLAGFPVFAGGKAGAAVLLGPTGGFLLGFIAQAAVAGLAPPGQGRGKTVRRAVVFALATALLYLIGLPWLAVVAHLPAGKTLAVGLLPFVPGDLLKLAAAVAVTEALARAGLQAEGKNGRRSTNR
ncbi:MAG TPA: biotin transporter BioY [Firmicutes bacterium]|nr:biotin transporter BioY [Bacillota bacterium]